MNRYAPHEQKALAAFVFVLLGVLFFFFPGCAVLDGSKGPLVNVGGAQTTVRVILVEPGDVVTIIDDTQIQISVPAMKPGDPAAVSRRSLAGCVAMPISVYRQMRAKAYPDAPPPVIPGVSPAGSSDARKRADDSKIIIGDTGYCPPTTPAIDPHPEFHAVQGSSTLTVELPRVPCVPPTIVYTH